jgi:hypothetical protein
VTSTLEFTVLGLDFPVDSANKTVTPATGEQEAMPVNAGPTREHRRPAAQVFNPQGEMRWVGMGLLSTPDQNSGFAVSPLAVPAGAVRRPYSGNVPAPTQKGLSQ